MWCIHNNKQVSWTYWLINQLLTYASHKDAPLTHRYVITIVAKALNLNLDNYTHFVECSYFTKQAFIRGEVVDATFLLIPAPSHSCLRGLERPTPIKEP